MRKDMSKVIVERPRLDHRGAWARRGRSRPLEDEEGASLRERIPTRDPKQTKWLNENLAPLKRYLAAQVGRPWSKVYSEICANLRPSSTVQQHVRDHVEDIVAVKTRMRDGKVVTLGRYGGETPAEREWRRLYVHPRTGLLCARKGPPLTFRRGQALRDEEARKTRAARALDVAPDVQLHKLKDGAWWEVGLAKVKRRAVPGGTETLPHVDVVARAGLADRPLAELYGRDGVYAANMRKLTPGEKRRYRLK
jgi:hypothetical protein